MAIVPKNKGAMKIRSRRASCVLRKKTRRFVLKITQKPKKWSSAAWASSICDVIVSKLKSKFGVDVTLQKARVPYRETIRKTVSVQGRHKKQTGGHGQFGDVWIEFSPLRCRRLGVCRARCRRRSAERASSPPLKRVCASASQEVLLAGYPVVGLKATLYDGSYHPVDSSEMAFKTAASIAYKTACRRRTPVLA